MIAPAETFDGTFPFTAHFTHAPGFQMHYVDEGHGAPVLCLHGEPTWGYLFRHIIPTLAQNNRVIVQAHVDNLQALVLELDLHEITLVMHDWGGPIGSGLAFKYPERIKRLVVTNTPMTFGLPGEAELLLSNTHESRYFQWMGQLYQSGALETVLGNFNVILLSVMKTLQGFERVEAITPTWLRAYNAPFATPEECRGAIAFPRSIVSNQGNRLTGFTPQAMAAIRAKPAMMIEGMRDQVLLPRYFIPIFEAAFPHGKVYRLENAGHFLYEDEPAAIALLIQQFIWNS